MPYQKGNQFQMTITISEKNYNRIVNIAEQYEWSINKTVTKLIELGISQEESEYVIYNELSERRKKCKEIKKRL